MRDEITDKQPELSATKKLSFDSPEERDEFWEAAIAEQTDSGLSVRAFCIEQGLPLSSFHKWRQKFQAPKKLIKSSAEDKSNFPESKLSPKPEFTEIKFPVELPGKRDGIKISYGNFQLSLQDNCDRQLLRDLLGMLGEMPC